MSADFLYWLGSTVAQSVVALIAFGAFIGVWRRDAIWNAVEPWMPEHSSACREFLNTKMTVSEQVDENMVRMHSFGVDIHLVHEEGTDSTVRAVRNKVAEFRGAIDPDERLAAIVAATEPLLEFPFPDEMQGQAKVILNDLRRLGIPIIQAHHTRTRISNSLNQLVRAGLGAFVLSLLLMALAEPATAREAPPIVAFAGFAALALLTGATALTVAAAANLARASFGETGAPSK